MGCPLGGRGVAWQGCEPLGIEGVQDIADGLVVAAQGLANHAGRLTTGTGKQDLTASQHKGIGRAQPLLQGVLFVLGQWTDIDRFSHTKEYTTFPNTLRGTALGRRKTMAKDLCQATYTSEAWAAQVRHPQNRVEV